MRSSLLRVALTAILLAVIGCAVTHADIDRWKRTQRGPGKITAVLVGTRYARDLRVHAARALIEMKHPNANGLDLLNQAMASMPPADREAILHELLPALRSQMRGVGQQQTDSGPSEPQIRAKDAAYLLLRYASAADRQEVANELLNWELSDLNTRALAGQYTAEQVVTAIGPSAAERLAQAYTTNDDSITVSVQLSQLVNSVGTDAGKDLAVDRVIAVTREISSTSTENTTRLRTTAERLLRRSMPAGQSPTPERLQSAMEYIRGQYLNLLYESIKTLNRPRGTEYLLSVATNPATPLERRKTVLGAVAGQVRPSDAPQLLQIASAQGSDLELRGAAVDRVGETRNTTPPVMTQLWTLFNTTNGDDQSGEYMLRWKVGEAILKLGGAAIVPEFARQLAMPRAAGFAGYTFREINGFATAIGDFTPPPVATMRGLLSQANVYVKALALLFLGAKGDASDLPRIDALISDATPMAGAGWQAERLPNLGHVAARARDSLRRNLNMPAVTTPAPPAAGAAGAPAAEAPASARRAR